jgi:hypothetical protein
MVLALKALALHYFDDFFVGFQSPFPGVRIQLTFREAARYSLHRPLSVRLLQWSRHQHINSLKVVLRTD